MPGRPAGCCAQLRPDPFSNRVTFTVPDELRSLLRACPQEGYDAIFAAGSATIQELLADPKWLGSPNVGFFGVLHTWGRDPEIYHPHVHFVVPCGGVSPDGAVRLGATECGGASEGSAYVEIDGEPLPKSSPEDAAVIAAALRANMPQGEAA